jgi:hypothetical protein
MKGHERMPYSWWYLFGRTDNKHRRALNNDVWSCVSIRGKMLNVGQTRNCCSKLLISVEDGNYTSVVLEQHPARQLYYKELSLLQPIMDVTRQNPSRLTGILPNFFSLLAEILSSPFLI